MTGPQRQRRKRRKLSDKQVMTIVDRVGEGGKYGEVASEFSVSEATVRKIAEGRLYSLTTGIPDRALADLEQDLRQDL